MVHEKIRNKVARVAAIIAIAFTFGGWFAPMASADGNSIDAYVDTMVLQWASICTQNGGQPDIYLQFNESGHVSYAMVSCYGQTGSWGPNWYCSMFSDGYWNCAPGFTQPPQNPVESTTAQDGSIVVAKDEAPTPTPVVVERADSKPTVPARPGDAPAPQTSPTPEPSPTPGSGRR